MKTVPMTRPHRGSRLCGTWHITTALPSGETWRDPPEQSMYFSVHHSDFCGVIRTSELDVDPMYCNGHSRLYNTEGWGLLRLILRWPLRGADGSDQETQRSELSHLSEAKALQNARGSSGLGDPKAWNWPAVKSGFGAIRKHIRENSVRTDEGGFLLEHAAHDAGLK